MNYIEQFIVRVSSEALISGNEIRGCSKDELVKLKEKAKEVEVSLPQAYLDFLAFGGYQIGAMLINCDFNYAFCLKQLDRIDQKKNIINGFIFLQSWQDKFYFRFDDDSPNPFIYHLNSGGKSENTQNRLSDFLIDKMQNYIDARGVIELNTRLALAITRRGLIDLKYTYLKFENSVFYRSIERVIELIDTLHKKKQEKRASAKVDMVTYLDGLLSKSKKATFIRDDGCIKIISLLKENFIYNSNDVDFEKMNLFKERITAYIFIKKKNVKDLKNAKEYISGWQDDEIKTNHTKAKIRIRAKWFKPQLIYFYNKEVNRKSNM